MSSRAGSVRWIGFITVALAAAVLGALATGNASAKDKPVSEGILVTRLGSDTLTIERFERYGDRATGRVARRVPRTSLLEYDVRLDAAGHPREATFRILPPPGAATPAPRTIRVSLRPDSTVSEEMRDTLVRRAWAQPDAYLAMADSYGLTELWLAWLRAQRGDSAAFVVVAPLGGAASGRVRARTAGRDGYDLQFPSGAVHVVVDAKGRLQRWDGSGSTLKYVAERVKSADFEGFMARSAALDAQGKALGAWVSPRDTVRATAGACSLWVDYGRPSKRGRRVFENGVLGDTLWRTGANAATQFSTSREITLGGRSLAAGRYTLWTRVRGDRYALVVNAQTGQWGTAHDAGRDLFEVPLEKRALSPDVEMFTIRVDGGEDGRGLLRLQWDDVELVTPFAVVP